MRTKLILSVFFLFMGICITVGQNEEKDWAQFDKYAQANKEVKQPVKVVFMGNSITEGWHYHDPDFFKNNNYVGRGISGQVTSQMLTRFRADVINLKPKAVVILAGINDIALNNGYISIEHVFDNIISMRELAKANKIKVVLCSVLPANYFPWREELNPVDAVGKLNEMIKTYALKNKIPYVDYYKAMVDEKSGLDIRYQHDEVHPNLAGYKLMEEVVQKELKKVVK